MAMACEGSKGAEPPAHRVPKELVSAPFGFVSRGLSMVIPVVEGAIKFKEEVMPWA